jgi:hypothetical protein
MIAGVRALTVGLYAKLRGVNEEARVPENSGLKPRQIGTQSVMGMLSCTRAHQEAGFRMCMCR